MQLVWYGLFVGMPLAAAALMVGRLHMFACLPFLALALWGFFQAQEMTAATRAVPGQCAIQTQ